jgi:hypothetical protein
MRAELKKQWCQALRSGDYTQAKSTLYDAKEDGYCCLGVLCHLVGGNLQMTSYEPLARLLQEGKEPPFDADAWFDRQNEIDHLTWMNDVGDKSFTEIAAYIEEKI